MVCTGMYVRSKSEKKCVIVTVIWGIYEDLEPLLMLMMMMMSLFSSRKEACPGPGNNCTLPSRKKRKNHQPG